MQLKQLALILQATSLFLATSCSDRVPAQKNEPGEDGEYSWRSAYACGDSVKQFNGQEQKVAAIECIKKALGPNREQPIYEMYLRDIQRMGLWDTAWETALPRDPELKSLIEKRCSENAKEEVFASVQGAPPVFLEIQGSHAFQDIYLSTTLSGLGYTKLWYRIWPNVEADAQLFGDPKSNTGNLPVVLFRNYGQPIYQSERSAKIILTFKRESTDDEERVGLYGRTVLVYDSRSDKLLGRRTEFFWLSPPGFRNGVRQELAICPMLKKGENSPYSFIGSILPCDEECRKNWVRY